MAYVNPMAVVLACVGHVADTLGVRLYDAADALNLKRMPDAFVAYNAAPVDVQDGLAVMDTATYLIPVTFYDVRARTGGTETDVTVGSNLANIANAAAAFAEWRGEYAVVKADASAFTIGGDDEVSEALAAMNAVAKGSVTVVLTVLV